MLRALVDRSGEERGRAAANSLLRDRVVIRLQRTERHPRQNYKTVIPSNGCGLYLEPAP